MVWSAAETLALAILRRRRTIHTDNGGHQAVNADSHFDDLTDYSAK